MNARSGALPPAPGTVLRLALVGWGLGDLALGRRRAGLTWLGAEIVAALLVAYLVIGLADTTWYLLAYLAGIAFLVAWAGQAVWAYQHAQRAQGAIGPTPPRSAAAAVAWLCLPLLVWGTGFWLVAGGASSPAAVIDGFETSWPQAASGHRLDPALGLDPATERTASAALERLQALCRAGSLSSDCADAPASLLRDVRFRISRVDETHASADAEVVTFERRPSSFLGLFSTTDLVPVPRETVLHLELETVPAALPGGLRFGAARWKIVAASGGGLADRPGS